MQWLPQNAVVVGDTLVDVQDVLCTDILYNNNTHHAHSPVFRVQQKERYLKVDELWTATDLNSYCSSSPAVKSPLYIVIVREKINTVNACSRKNKHTNVVRFWAMAWPLYVHTETQIHMTGWSCNILMWCWTKVQKMKATVLFVPKQN